MHTDPLCLEPLAELLAIPSKNITWDMIDALLIAQPARPAIRAALYEIDRRRKLQMKYEDLFSEFDQATETGDCIRWPEASRARIVEMIGVLEEMSALGLPRMQAWFNQHRRKGVTK